MKHYRTLGGRARDSGWSALRGPLRVRPNLKGAALMKRPPAFWWSLNWDSLSFNEQVWRIFAVAGLIWGVLHTVAFLANLDK